jgi:peroxiredoxin family protein
MTDENQMMGEEQLIEVIENQLADNNPIKAKETLMRLMMTGTPRDEAVAMMACAVAIEIFDVMKNDSEFDLKRYSENLDSLPDLSFMEGE